MTLSISLHGVRARGRVALIDDADYPLVSQYRWHVKEDRARPDHLSGPYAHTSCLADGAETKITMHKLITGWPLTDHIDRNGLNNQRSNLRPATRAQNNFNQRPRGGSSTYKGVSALSRNGSWQAGIKVARQRHYLGTFASEIEAAKAYDAAAREFFGEFAYLNFPERAS